MKGVEPMPSKPLDIRKEYVKTNNPVCGICCKPIEGDDLDNCDVSITKRKTRMFFHKKCIKLMR